MQKDTDNLALSDREIRIFAAGISAAGMFTGMLFYNSPAAGILLAAVMIAFFPLYKKTLIKLMESF